TPANGATSAAVDAVITIVFDEPLDATTATPASAQLTGPGGGTIAAMVDCQDRTITITPTRRLPGNAFMTGKVSTQIRDVAGNPLAAEFSWTFTTGVGTDVILGAQEFTVRDIPPDGVPDVFVGGTPPPRILFIKKGTEDRAIVEFDISRFPTTIVSAKLD